jgi:hypothetical protein
MEKSSIYRLLALKWLDAAEGVENRALRRCYAKRAMTYQTLAATCTLRPSTERESAAPNYDNWPQPGGL